MSEVKLLPVPELPLVLERFVLSSLSQFKAEGVRHELRKMLRDYARANVSHATAAQDAEIEALRAEVSRQEALKEKYTLQSDGWEHKARASEALAQQPAPSVPVGVVEAFEEYHKADHRDPAVASEWEWWQAAWKAAVASQPAAVDESLVERFCGRWFQMSGRSLDRPTVRECLAEALAAAQPGGSDNDH